MKATTIKKINLVVSLWLIAITVCLCIFAYELDVFGCYIAAIAVGGLLLTSNLISIISGLTSLRQTSIQSKRQYR